MVRGTGTGFLLNYDIVAGQRCKRSVLESLFQTRTWNNNLAEREERRIRRGTHYLLRTRVTINVMDLPVAHFWSSLDMSVKLKLNDSKKHNLMPWSHTPVLGNSIKKVVNYKLVMTCSSRGSFTACSVPLRVIWDCP